MLAAMTYNTGIFVSTISGLAAGYFLFFLGDSASAAVQLGPMQQGHDASSCHGGS